MEFIMTFGLKPFAVAAIFVAITPVGASAGGLKSKTTAAPSSHVVAINHEHRPRWKKRRAHRYHDHDSDHVVDAPFTHVETGYRRRVAVDAPFTGVRVSRRGVWVRAPFVDLYVPRY
jgi:hypothetical protein